MKKEENLVLVATSNPGKIVEIAGVFGGSNILVKYLSDFPEKKWSDPKEIGKTYHENAELKAREYLTQASIFGNFTVLADDSGIKITSLPGKLGVLTKRFVYEVEKPIRELPKHIQIEEAVLYAMKGKKNRSAVFETVVAMCLPTGEIKFFSGELKGKIRKEAIKKYRKPGMAFAAIFEIDDWSHEDGKPMLLGELYELRNNEPLSLNVKLTHREQAFIKVKKYILKD